MSNILVLDGANLLHRARSGFQLGDFNVAYNFFRQLRPLVEKFAPTRVYMTLEGAPKRQLALLPEYKANRAIDVTTEAGDKKQKSLEDFWRQKDLIVSLLSAHFPISIIRHPDFEGDDVVYNVVKRSSQTADFTIVSTDSDFTQVLQEFVNVRLYNPVTKKFVEAPKDYDYVVWKALRGDTSDNVPGLVTEAEALRLASSRFEDMTAAEWTKWNGSQEFIRNCQLIGLYALTDEEALLMHSSSPTRDWDAVKARLNEWEFRSMTKDGAWDKFVATFDPLWG
jgi:5'-3' exonuclease